MAKISKKFLILFISLILSKFLHAGDVMPESFLPPVILENPCATIKKMHVGTAQQILGTISGFNNALYAQRLVSWNALSEEEKVVHRELDVLIEEIYKEKLAQKNAVQEQTPTDMAYTILAAAFSKFARQEEVIAAKAKQDEGNLKYEARKAALDKLLMDKFSMEEELKKKAEMSSWFIVKAQDGIYRIEYKPINLTFNKDQMAILQNFITEQINSEPSFILNSERKKWGKYISLDFSNEEKAQYCADIFNQHKNKILNERIQDNKLAARAQRVKNMSMDQQMAEIFLIQQQLNENRAKWFQ